MFNMNQTSTSNPPLFLLNCISDMDKMKKPLDQVLCECYYHPDDDGEDEDITGGSTFHKGQLKKLGIHEFCNYCLSETLKQQCPVYNQILEQYPLDKDQAVSKVSPPEVGRAHSISTVHVVFSANS